MRKISVLNYIVVLALALFLIQCGGKESEGSETPEVENDSLKTEAKDGKEKGDKEKEEELVPVEVVTIETGSISNFILLSSNLETEVMADVYARVQGIVDEIFKEEGQYVAKGQVMISLEAKEFELAEQKARVNYEQQLSNYKRLEAMYKKSLLSDEEFETARFTLQGSEIQWKEAKLNLDFTKVEAPISGRVGERLAKIGRRIQPTDKLFSVVDNSQVIAVVYVPEKNLNQLKVGQKAFVFSDHISGQSFDGWIKRISPVVDPGSGTFKVTVGVRNYKSMLRPGMFVNVNIVIDTHEDVVLVPKTAIVYENEYVNVYVVRDSVAHKVRLKAGFQDNMNIESLEEIKAGEKVIVVGQAGMKDKTKVRIVQERKKASVARKDD